MHFGAYSEGRSGSRLALRVRESAAKSERMDMITVIDVGLGNVASVQNMLTRIGSTVRLVSSAEELVAGEPIVLPGVGSFDAGMERLSDAGLLEVLRTLPKEQPILGICLGMQLLGEASEEGQSVGVGRVKARFRKFPPGLLPVPHMGWNHVDFRSDPVFDDLPPEPRFYFTHSYYAECLDERDVAGRATYGVPFTAAFKHGETYGVQFHPEKSHRFGRSLLATWLERAC